MANLLFSQRGSFCDTVRLRFLFDKLQNAIKFVHDAPKSRPDRAGNVPFRYFVASPAGTITCGSHASTQLHKTLATSCNFGGVGTCLFFCTSSIWKRTGQAEVFGVRVWQTKALIKIWLQDLKQGQAGQTQWSLYILT